MSSGLNILPKQKPPHGGLINLDALYKPVGIPAVTAANICRPKPAIKK